MKKIYISLIIILVAFTASAQNLWLGAEGQKFYDELLIRKALKGEVEDYEGSPYMDEEFTEAIVISSDSNIYKGVPLRYNVYNDLFEVKLEDGAYALKRGVIVCEVIMGDHSFIYTLYDYQSVEKEGYLEIIAEGEYSLLKQYQVVFKQAEPVKPYQDARPAIFQTRDPLLYISHGDSKPVFVRNKKYLLDIAGDKGKALNDFMKDNKLKMRSQEDMIKAVEFLNSLK